MHIVLFGTHPKQMNGYSKVIYELSNQVSKSHTEVQLSIFGFQNFINNVNHRSEMPSNVDIYDAYAKEDPKKHGFGYEQVCDYLKSKNPNIVVIYNDPAVIYKILNEVEKVKSEMNFKVVLYLDQVYQNQKKIFINMINEKADAIMVFTDYWKECISKQGVNIPIHVLEHGINKDNYFPVPRDVARRYFGINENDFIVLNLNRNQPRKRWDICIKAWAEIVKRYLNDPVKLLIGTSINGAWDILEIYERELNKRDLTIEQGMKHVIILDNAQQLTDNDINILYNATNLGLTTCDGEGWGLCSFEHASVGVPQIAPKIGGFLEFLNEENSYLIEPSWAYYVDNTRDIVCGEAQVCNYMDFVENIETCYKNKEKNKVVSRKDILSKYNWETITNKFISMMKSTYGEIEKQISLEPEVIPNELLQNNEQYATKAELNEINSKIDAILSLLKKE